LIFMLGYILVRQALLLALPGISRRNHRRTAHMRRFRFCP
jgi:hypothetical protein